MVECATGEAILGGGNLEPRDEQILMIEPANVSSILFAQRTYSVMIVIAGRHVVEERGSGYILDIK